MEHRSWSFHHEADVNTGQRVKSSALARLAGAALAVVLATQLLLTLVHNQKFQDQLLEGWASGAHGIIEPVTLTYLRTYLAGSGPALLEDLRFSYRERVHFREVRNLLELAGRVRSFALAACLIIAGVGLVRGGNRWRCEIAGLASATGVTLLGLLAPVLLLTGAFDQGFALLHLPLFSGTNWVLAPTALTLKLFPKSYFVGFTICFGVLLAVAAISLMVAARLLRGPAAAIRS
jgi:uncharacterized membrane protein